MLNIQTETLVYILTKDYCYNMAEKNDTPDHSPVGVPHNREKNPQLSEDKFHG
jgi:hypothetical protein